MTTTIEDLHATEARLKDQGWSEGNLRWWRRAAYAEACIPLPVIVEPNATASRGKESGADWAKRLTGKTASKPAPGSLAERAIALGYGRDKPRHVGVEER